MRIQTSDYYANHYDCPLDDCERHYCSGKTHRFLYRTCESVIERDGETASWEDGGSKHWTSYTGECPKCKHEYEMRRYEEWAKKQEANHV